MLVFMLVWRLKQCWCPNFYLLIYFYVDFSCPLNCCWTHLSILMSICVLYSIVASPYYNDIIKTAPLKHRYNNNMQGCGSCQPECSQCITDRACCKTCHNITTACICEALREQADGIPDSLTYWYCITPPCKLLYIFIIKVWASY